MRTLTLTTCALFVCACSTTPPPTRPSEELASPTGASSAPPPPPDDAALQGCRITAPSPSARDLDCGFFTARVDGSTLSCDARYGAIRTARCPRILARLQQALPDAGERPLVAMGQELPHVQGQCSLWSAGRIACQDSALHWEERDTEGAWEPLPARYGRVTRRADVVCTAAGAPARCARLWGTYDDGAPLVVTVVTTGDGRRFHCLAPNDDIAPVCSTFVSLAPPADKANAAR